MFWVHAGRAIVQRIGQGLRVHAAFEQRDAAARDGLAFGPTVSRLAHVL